MYNLFSGTGFMRMDDYVYALLQKDKGDNEIKNEPDNSSRQVNDRKTTYLFLSLISLVLVGIFDFYTGNRMSFMPFYVVPIMIAEMCVGSLWGTIMPVLSGFTWLLANIDSGSGGVVLFWNALVRTSFFIMVVFLIRAVHDLRTEKAQARTDYLTGLANKRSFYELADQEIKRSKRYGHPLSLIFMDCDNFKKVNDQFGHKTGDDLICAVAGEIRKNIRGSDIAARFGGDEFVVLLPETDFKGLREFVERLNNSIPHMGRNYGWPVTASIGAVSYRTPLDSIDNMVSKADVLMYAAKNKTNGNRIEIFCD